MPGRERERERERERGRDGFVQSTDDNFHSEKNYVTTLPFFK
jgi:hypothetical protein